MKTFTDHIDSYLKENWEMLLTKEVRDNIKDRLLKEHYISVPFEIRIGLLKYICDHKTMGHELFLAAVVLNRSTDRLDIVPRKLLTTLF